MKLFWANAETEDTVRGHSDTGGASRFFFTVREQLDHADPIYYCAKSGRRERDAGLEEIPLQRVIRREGGTRPSRANGPITADDEKWETQARNSHPTVKPIALVKYLATLLLPPSEYAPRRIFCPFGGVGSEMIGALLAGWEEVVGVELEQEYVNIGTARIAYWQQKQSQPTLAGI